MVMPEGLVGLGDHWRSSSLEERRGHLSTQTGEVLHPSDASASGANPGGGQLPAEWLATVPSSPPTLDMQELQQSRTGALQSANPLWQQCSCD